MRRHDVRCILHKIFAQTGCEMYFGCALCSKRIIGLYCMCLCSERILRYILLCAQTWCEVYLGCFMFSERIQGVIWMFCVLRHDVRCVLDVLCAHTLCEVCF